MLARRPALWHGAAMKRRSPAAGGIFLFGGILGGLAVGMAFGQPTLGAIGGTLLGAALALLVWGIDRRR